MHIRSNFAQQRCERKPPGCENGLCLMLLILINVLLRHSFLIYTNSPQNESREQKSVLLEKKIGGGKSQPRKALQLLQRTDQLRKECAKVRIGIGIQFRRGQINVAVIS